MSKKIMVLQGHPDAKDRHLCHALAEAYLKGAEEAGHQALLVDVASLKFPILRSKEEWEKSSTPEGLLEVQSQLLDADHLVIFFPLWLGTMPALFKAFLEQVFRPGLNQSKANNPVEWRKLMKGCSARIVVTMGMPAFFYRWFYRAHGLSVLRRNILSFSGVGPIRSSLVGLVDNMDEEKAKKWFHKMQCLGRTAK